MILRAYLVSISVDQRRSATWQVTWDAVPSPLQGSMGSDPFERQLSAALSDLSAAAELWIFILPSSARAATESVGQSQSRLGVTMEVSSDLFQSMISCRN